MIDMTFVAQLGGQEGVLARTIWGEARGDGVAGMRAVASVLMNRCTIATAYVAEHGRPHPLYGDGTPASACLAPWQISSWNAKDPNRQKMIAVSAESDPVFAQAIDIAAEAIARTLQDPTDGATSYKTTALPWPTEWGPEVPPLAVIGHQSFYQLA
jgi:hypothetical protein